MSKYYTPEIEEFHVGFEYDTLGKELNESNGRYEDIWRKSVVDDDDGDIQNPFDNFNYGIQTQTIRVKHLDREDIESFKLDPEKYKITKEFNHYHISEKLMITADENPRWSIRFSGTIKNKSELKRLLKQLGI